MKKAFLFGLICVGCVSCLERQEYTQEEIDIMIRARVEEKVASYRQIKTERCTEDILVRANAIADSILIEEARLHRDTVGKPPRPLKPQPPEIRHVKDTAPLRPLFDPDTLRSRRPDSTATDSLLLKKR